MSVMWVSRMMSLLMRCERSPTPVSVGENTLWPFFSRRSDTRRQHQPPCQAPCTSTKVFGAPVSEVVGRRVKLKKAGREWRGLSPFNQEKTPSFFANDHKMAWFDFSSGKNGNIFDFVMLTEGLSFPEAVERLATQAGMPLPQVSREDEARDQRRKSLIDIVELAAKFFEATLASRLRGQARC